MWQFLTAILKEISASLGGGKSQKDWPKYDVNEEGIVEISSEGNETKHPWSDVQHVGILTTSDGPWSEDVFLIIKTNHGDLCITHDQAQKTKLLIHFENLPDFRWEAVVEAMSCTSPS